MKKIFLLLVFMVIVISNASAYDYEVDGIFYNKLSENTVEVTYENQSYATTNYAESITIPSTITNEGVIYNVTSIGKSAFRDCSELVSIKIPQGVISIGEYAFAGCSALTEISIPKGVTSIELGVFQHCKSLASVKIPEGVTYIGGDAFFNCSGLASITIPDGVTTIGSDAFRHCTGLTSIIIPKSVKYIGLEAFRDNESLNAVYISDLAAWCNIDFQCPDLVTNYSSNPLLYAHNLYLNNELLTNAIIPNNVSSISNAAFHSCECLESINIPDGINSIGEYAFIGCEKLSSITMSSRITKIEKSTFYGCCSLTSINIPDGVTSIGESAFNYCSKLKEVNISNIESWMKIDMAENAFPYSHDLFVNGLKLTDLIVPESITTIGKFAFYNCTSLESITLHKDVTTIVQNAFNVCKNVKKIICQGDTPPACGAKALEGISRTECTLYVPETSGSNYNSTSPWSEFTNIVGGSTDTPEAPQTCKAPTIAFDNDAKKLVFTSATEGAKYHCTITSDDMMNDKAIDSEATMTGVYNITAYASADGMYNSEKTTGKLCWVSAAIESDGIMAAKADRGVIVSSNDGQINISGTVNSETIEVYNVGGSKLKAIKANSGNTTINGLQSGNMYIIKIGGNNVKVTL